MAIGRPKPRILRVEALRCVAQQEGETLLSAVPEVGSSPAFEVSWCWPSGSYGYTRIRVFIEPKRLSRFVNHMSQGVHRAEQNTLYLCSCDIEAT